MPNVGARKIKSHSKGAPNASYSVEVSARGRAAFLDDRSVLPRRSVAQMLREREAGEP